MADKTADDSLNERFISAAESLWAESIREPGRKGSCPEVMRRNSWAWAIKKHPDYCGHTLGAMGRQAGVRPEICLRTFPSTDRLAGRVRSGVWRPEPALDVPVSQLQRGDIVTVNPTPKRPWGTHIVLCVAIGRKDLFYTIEGNSYGMLGDGHMGRGVVRKSRQRASIAKIYRLKSCHYEDGAQDD